MSKTKINIFKILLACCLFPATARLQVNLFLGTKTPYVAASPNKITKPPNGYSAVFINYTGRHGARFMTKPGADLEVLALLTYAEENHFLSPKGKLVKSMAERFLLIEKNNYENITLLGAAEQEAIGKRLFTGYPKAFRGQGIEIIMTHKVRTQQSADAFLRGIDAYAGKKNKRIIADEKDDILRFYDLSPAYQEFKKNALLAKKTDSVHANPQTHKSAENICAKLFTEAFANKLLKENITVEVNNKSVPVNAVSLMQDLYELYAIQFSIPLEMKQNGYEGKDINFGIVFDKKDLAWLDFANGAEDFLQKGAGTDTLGIQVTVAMPLLSGYINSTQDAIDQKIKTDGIFRFTHAEAISPYATLLGIRQASIPSASVFNYNKNWQAASIIPLSANICWIVYSNGKDYLVKILLNEKEVAVPVATDIYPFYKWKDIKEYYLTKMKKLNTAPDQDMHQYLLNLR